MLRENNFRQDGDAGRKSSWNFSVANVAHHDQPIRYKYQETADEGVRQDGYRLTSRRWVYENMAEFFSRRDYAFGLAEIPTDNTSLGRALLRT